jgi:hypothetical protein
LRAFPFLEPLTHKRISKTLRGSVFSIAAEAPPDFRHSRTKLGILRCEQRVSEQSMDRLMRTQDHSHGAQNGSGRNALGRMTYAIPQLAV